MIGLMIAQIKFVGTFLVPSLFPSIVAAAAFGVALIMPPPGSEWPFAANVLMWVGVITMCATCILVLKKLLGRQPSLTEILSGLVTVAHLDNYKEEQRLRAVGLEKQISDARHQFDERVNSDLKRTLEMFADLSRRSEEREKIIAELQAVSYRLQERTETHLRKLDANDTKMDNLLAQVSRAAALLQQAGRDSA